MKNLNFNLKEAWSNFKGISEKEVVLFTRQFATMVAAGLSVSKCLEVLKEQATHPKFKDIIADIQSQVAAGFPLSASFASYPLVFSKTYVALCKAAETSGRLDEVFLKLADALERDESIKSKFKTALIYPSIIVIAMFGVFVLMMFVVIPKLSELYDTMGVELPFITKIMIGISDLMLRFKFVLILLPFVLVYLFRYFMQSKRGRELWSEFVFLLPVIGAVNRLKDYAIFTRTLSMLLNAGVPLIDSLGISLEVVNNIDLQKAARSCLYMVEKGLPLSEAMQKSGVFPSMVYRMVQVGEETGSLDDVLAKVSNYYSEEVNTGVSRLSAALEPFILVLLGAGVGLLILSVITPIYKITTSI